MLVDEYRKAVQRIAWLGVVFVVLGMVSLWYALSESEPAVLFASAYVALGTLLSAFVVVSVYYAVLGHLGGRSGATVAQAKRRR